MLLWYVWFKFHIQIKYIKIKGLSKIKSQEARIYQITSKGEAYFSEIIKSAIISNKTIDVKLDSTEITAIFEYANKEEQIEYIENLKENIIKSKETLYKNKKLKTKAEKYIFLEREKILFALEEWITEIKNDILTDEV